MMLYILAILLISFSTNYSQSDTIKYPWPTPPFNSSRGLTGTFGEFRNTGSADHFHNAVDIGEPDGNPVYPSITGEVYYLSNNGYDSYINVKSIINNQKKHITYYHVVPNPSLSIGQAVVAGETVIGTIYVGAAHVHLIERELLPTSSSGIGNEINPVRPEGGLFPYYDTYPPSISSSSLTFFKDNSSVTLPSNQLTGKVDIRIEVREKNGPLYSHGNNGTYILGYRVLSEDGDSLVYEPDDNGVKYRFYYIPYDSHVHQVFVKNVATLSDPIYWLTNGDGESHINSTFSVGNNYLDTDLFDEGSYLLEIFSEDTRENTTSKRFNFSIAKLPPELLTVKNNNDSISISWAPYKLNNLQGYRIYYSVDPSSLDWHIAANENQLSANMNRISFSGPQEFLTPSEESEFYFYITAVKEDGTESSQSDIYSLSLTDSNNPSILIVDGFDLHGDKGSWHQPQHSFNKFYFDAISENGDFNISSSSNESVSSDEINLLDFNIIVWFVGDESLSDNTFVNAEQYRLAQFLENGGKLFVSGEDIGLDLDTKHSFSEFSDTLFYRHYLKSEFVHDGLDLLYEVNGEEGTQFFDLNVQFGETYPVERPDDIEPLYGAHSIFNYTYERDETFRKGGIAYNGMFGSSDQVGSIVYLSFPFETIESEAVRSELFRRVLDYFENGPVNVEGQDNGIVDDFSLSQNYPNPFNPQTLIKYTIPNNINLSSVELKVFNVLGQEVITLVDSKQGAGNYEVNFDGSELSSGIYLYRLTVRPQRSNSVSRSGQSQDYVETRKMILLK